MNKLNDNSLVIKSLKDDIGKFIKDRNWQKYHNPKNLAMSIAIEAGELMEIFQWLSPRKAQQVRVSIDRARQAREELADVMIYCIMLAMALDIDLSSAILDKMENNKIRYPTRKHARAHGRSNTKKSLA
jgi:dCTP diphosphatase